MGGIITRAALAHPLLRKYRSVPYKIVVFSIISFVYTNLTNEKDINTAPVRTLLRK